MNNNFKYKDDRHQILEFTLIFVLLIFPKLDLIEIPNYHQGIRFEDLVVIYIGISLLISKTFEIQKQDFGYYFYIYFFILLFSIIHGSLYFNQKWVILPRYLEYIIILIYFNRHEPDLKSIFLILRLYLIFNLIFVILQINGLIGEFSSLGYENPENLSDDRPTGLTGGPWELSNCCAIIFFTLLLDKNQSSFSKYFYSFIILYLIHVTQSRTVLVAFIIAGLLYYYIQYINIKKYYLFTTFVVSLTTLLILIANISNFFETFDDVYFELVPMFKNFIYFQQIPNWDILDLRLWSMAYRIEHWVPFYKQFLLNPFTIVFGSGSTFVYYESTVFRILFGTGIFGLIFVIFSIKKYLYIYFCYLRLVVYHWIYF